MYLWVQPYIFGIITLHVPHKGGGGVVVGTCPPLTTYFAVKGTLLSHLRKLVGMVKGLTHISQPLHITVGLFRPPAKVLGHYPDNEKKGKVKISTS